jgi:tetratricopeptide (TPR) repeat protein
MGILLSTSLALFANLALAQADPAADHYKAGVAHFHAGQFAEAIQEFRAADAIRPSAVLSFDVAQCYEKMADLAAAKTAYQDYLRRAPSAEDRPAVEATIASIDQKLAQQPRDMVVLVPASPAAPGASGAPGPDLQVSASRSGPNLALGITLASIGAAGLIAGAILNGLSHNASLSLQNDGTVVMRSPRYWSQSEAQGYYNTAQNDWTGALIGYIAGGVLLATGGSILTYQLAAKPSP